MRYLNPYSFTLLITGPVGIVVGVLLFIAGRNTTNLASQSVLGGTAGVLNGMVDQQFGIAISLAGAIAVIAGTVIVGLQWQPRP